jgi:hypothetical protein
MPRREGVWFCWLPAVFENEGDRTLIFTVQDTTFHCHGDPDGAEVLEIRYHVGKDRTFSEWRRIDGSRESRRW